METNFKQFLLNFRKISEYKEQPIYKNNQSADQKQSISSSKQFVYQQIPKTTLLRIVILLLQ